MIIIVVEGLEDAVLLELFVSDGRCQIRREEYSHRIAYCGSIIGYQGYNVQASETRRRRKGQSIEYRVKDKSSRSRAGASKRPARASPANAVPGERSFCCLNLSSS